MLVHPAFRYIWTWYFEVSERFRRVRDGICEPIPPTQFQAWKSLSGAVVYPSEYGILCDMDDAYCAAMNSELADFRIRQEEDAKNKDHRGR